MTDETRIALTEPDAYKLRTVLNRVLETGHGSINDISGRRTEDGVEIVMRGN